MKFFFALILLSGLQVAVSALTADQIPYVDESSSSEESYENVSLNRPCDTSYSGSENDCENGKCIAGFCTSNLELSITLKDDNNITNVTVWASPIPGDPYCIEVEAIDPIIQEPGTITIPNMQIGCTYSINVGADFYTTNSTNITILKSDENQLAFLMEVAICNEFGNCTQECKCNLTAGLVCNESTSFCTDCKELNKCPERAPCNSLAECDSSKGLICDPDTKRCQILIITYPLSIQLDWASTFEQMDLLLDKIDPETGLVTCSIRWNQYNCEPATLVTGDKTYGGPERIEITGTESESIYLIVAHAYYDGIYDAFTLPISITINFGALEITMNGDEVENGEVGLKYWVVGCVDTRNSRFQVLNRNDQSFPDASVCFQQT